jgi:hypothetical protein
MRLPGLPVACRDRSVCHCRESVVVDGLNLVVVVDEWMHSTGECTLCTLYPCKFCLLPLSLNLSSLGSSLELLLFFTLRFGDELQVAWIHGSWAPTAPDAAQPVAHEKTPLACLDDQTPMKAIISRELWAETLFVWFL